MTAVAQEHDTFIVSTPPLGESAVVVARRVDVYETDPCGGAANCLAMDAWYHGTYDLVQTVHGEAPPSRFEFTHAYGAVIDPTRRRALGCSAISPPSPT